jgi:hypothetical protein
MEAGTKASIGGKRKRHLSGTTGQVPFSCSDQGRTASHPLGLSFTAVGTPPGENDPAGPDRIPRHASGESRCRLQLLNALPLKDRQAGLSAAEALQAVLYRRCLSPEVGHIHYQS